MLSHSIVVGEQPDELWRTYFDCNASDIRYLPTVEYVSHVPEESLLRTPVVVQ